MTEQPAEQPQPPVVHITPEMMGGVWANFARVGHSPYEFTIDFTRLDFGSNPPEGIVVARVSLSPLFVTQLIQALDDNWSKYAESQMPPEVRDERPAVQDGSGADDEDAPA